MPRIIDESFYRNMQGGGFKFGDFIILAIILLSLLSIGSQTSSIIEGS